MEDLLYDKIIDERNEGRPVSTQTVIAYAKEIDPTLEERTVDSLRLWIYRFMARNNFTFRKVTHKYKASQVANLRQVVINHLNEMIMINQQMLYQKCSMFNMDEVPVYLNTYANIC